MVAHIKKEQIDEEWSSRMQSEMSATIGTQKISPVHVTMKTETDVACLVTMETNTTKKKRKPYVQRKLACNQCGKIYTGKQALEKHTISHTKVSRFMCNLCDYPAASQALLDIHKYTKHKPEEPFQCPVRQFVCNQCDKAYLTKQALERHNITHTKVSRFTCDTCGHVAVAQGLLDIHVSTKHPDEVDFKNPLRQFVCNQCDKAYHTKATLKKHRISHTKVSPFMCNTCGHAAVSKGYLDSHVRAKHSLEGPLKVPLRQFVCNQCDKVYGTKQALERHHISHTKVSPFMCDMCDYAATSQTTLDIHFRRKHTLERPFKCNHCDMAFPNKSEWQRHTRTHSEDKRFQCALCDYGGQDKNKLVRHMKLVHTNERSWPCDLCSKSFVDKSTLKDHMVTHSTEQPFECHLCHTSFKRKRGLAEHHRNFHRKSEKL